MLTVRDVYPDNFGLRVLLVEDNTGQRWETGVVPNHIRPVGERLLTYPDETVEACLRRYGGQWVRRAISRAAVVELFQWEQREWQIVDSVGRVHGTVVRWIDDAGQERYAGTLCDPDRNSKGTTSICDVSSLTVAMQAVEAAAKQRSQEMADNATDQ